VVNYSKIIKDNGITSIGLIHLKESLIKNKFLKEINFGSNCLKEEGCKVLNGILLENKNIEKINLSCKLFKNNKREQYKIKWSNFFKGVFNQE
jgi:hypothetical protein